MHFTNQVRRSSTDGITWTAMYRYQQGATIVWVDKKQHKQIQGIN